MVCNQIISVFCKAAEENKLEILTPEIGELFKMDEEKSEKWWEQYM